MSFGDGSLADPGDASTGGGVPGGGETSDGGIGVAGTGFSVATGAGLSLASTSSGLGLSLGSSGLGLSASPDTIAGFAGNVGASAAAAGAIADSAVAGIVNAPSTPAPTSFMEIVNTGLKAIGAVLSLASPGPFGKATGAATLAGMFSGRSNSLAPSFGIASSPAPSVGTTPAGWGEGYGSDVIGWGGSAVAGPSAIAASAIAQAPASSWGAAAIGAPGALSVSRTGIVPKQQPATIPPGFVLAGLAALIWN